MNRSIHSSIICNSQTWKQLKCTSTGEWIKMWYVCTHTQWNIYYSAIKKNEVMPFVATWMNLEVIILNEVSQTEDKYMISLICGI